MKNYDLRILDASSPASVRRVEVVGCLDSHTVVEFEKSLHQVVSDEKSNRVMIDLSGLNYISSAGISALMGLTHRLRKSGGDLILLKPTEKVHRVFRTLGFTNIFTIVENESAIQRTATS